MEYRERPRLLISRCIEFEHTRYDGQIIRSEIVRALKPHADIIHTCPEAEIGLGIPRRPVRIEEDKDGNRLLIQPAFSKDHTDKMRDFVERFLGGLPVIDGVILKSKSPSCGIGDVKIYPIGKKGPAKGRGNGFFGDEILKRYGDLAVEDEKRLLNEDIREHFLTKLFTTSRFREVMEAGDAKALVDFHSDHKFLLMAYDQSTMRKMGRVVADQRSLGVHEALRSYRELLLKAMGKGPGYKPVINVLQHCLGYFKDLSAEEKGFFLDMIDTYRDGRVPLSALTSVIRSWSIRFDQDYIKRQKFFDPYPEDLIIDHSQYRGRDLWK